MIGDIQNSFYPSKKLNQSGGLVGIVRDQILFRWSRQWPFRVYHSAQFSLRLTTSRSKHRFDRSLAPTARAEDLSLCAWNDTSSASCCSQPASVSSRTRFIWMINLSRIPSSPGDHHQRTDYGSFAAMGSKRDGITDALFEFSRPISVRFHSYPSQYRGHSKHQNNS
jgi:hypothetical protein